MIIFWRGYGFIVAIIVFIDSLIAELTTKMFVNDDFYQANNIPIGVSLIVSGLVIMALSKYFAIKKNANEGTRIFDRITIAEGGTFFFIPFSYWSYILCAIGVIIVIADFFKK